MRKPKSTPPKYRLTETTGMKTTSTETAGTETRGRNPFRMYSAGPGQTGQGRLVFHDTWVEVVLNPDSAWRSATKAKRKDSNKLKLPDGTWNVWFLLSRALVLSKEADAESEREMGPAHTLTEANNQLRSAGKARAMAADARLHALVEACVIGMEIPHEAASTNHDFVDWFEGQMAERLNANDQEFVEAVSGFVRAAAGLQVGYPQDVLKFSRVLREQASKAGGPPTKEAVRLAFGEESLGSLAKAEAVQKPSPSSNSGSRQRKTAADVIDPNTFTRLLKRTGFSWLPNGKTGPARQKKVGKGNSVEAFDLLLPKKSRQGRSGSI